MKRTVLAGLVAVVVTLAGCGPIQREKSEAKISPGSAPAQVTAAFQKDHPNAMINKLEKETYKDGTIHYEYTFTDASGKQQTVEYNTAGEQLPEH
jgi:hypothetical protein